MAELQKPPDIIHLAELVAVGLSLAVPPRPLFQTHSTKGSSLKPQRNGFKAVINKIEELSIAIYKPGH